MKLDQERLRRDSSSFLLALSVMRSRFPFIQCVIQIHVVDRVTTVHALEVQIILDGHDYLWYLNLEHVVVMWNVLID